MKLTYSFLFLGLVLCGPIYAQKTLAARQLSFEFLAKEVEGSLSGFSSESVIDLEDPARSVFEGSVLVKTLKTGNFLRDWSLKGSKYFDEDTYPKITFKSNRVEIKGDIIEVYGNLTLKGQTRPLTISFTKKENRLVGQASLNTTDYGITVLKKKKEDNEVAITLIFDLK